MRVTLNSRCLRLLLEIVYSLVVVISGLRLRISVVLIGLGSNVVCRNLTCGLSVALMNLRSLLIAGVGFDSARSFGQKLLSLGCLMLGLYLYLFASLLGFSLNGCNLFQDPCLARNVGLNDGDCILASIFDHSYATTSTHLLDTLRPVLSLGLALSNDLI